MEYEQSAGLNARLRPRKSTASSPQSSKIVRKPENKIALDRPKRTSTPSKSTPAKQDDLAIKSDFSPANLFLCPYCDKKFASKQTVSKHARRIHLANAKQDAFIDCMFCGHVEPDPNDIIQHMVENHPSQYFACVHCHTRFTSTSELSEHKFQVCEKHTEKPYRSRLRQKASSSTKKSQKLLDMSDDLDYDADRKDFTDAHRYNGVVISCELKPSQVNDEADIEDNITTNLILPPSKNLGNNAVIEKNAIIVLDDIQWNKRMPANFSFHNTDADQILSRLGVVHRSPRTGESNKKDWFKTEDVEKFEKCFDTSFYSKVASNVHENLSKFLDGSFNFNPDPNSVIKTRKSKNSVVINAAEGFPILLAYQQFSRNIIDGYIPRSMTPKHKWKWGNDKLLNADDIKCDPHVSNCIITLVSGLDIWTQLCMRHKFEKKFSIPPLEKKSDKQNIIGRELKEILESRELPTPSQQLVKFPVKPMHSRDSLEFPASLGLAPSAPSYDLSPAVLSGEWVRPRCYVCCACGAQSRDSRGLSSHMSTQHPNAQVQHYEIVGELLLNADILKHLYVPPIQMSNRTRPLRGIKECTKCSKSISLEDLHQHMLDCAGDTPAVRRKCRYRPFGVRRRRPRLPDNTIRRKMRKDIRSRQSRQKAHLRSRPKIRSEVGDAETIRKMLADLPAKRHRVMVNPMNPILRPRRKLDNKQRNKLMMKMRSTELTKHRERAIKKIDDIDRSGSNYMDNDDNDKKGHLSDDENIPLKPKIKRLLPQRTRQSDSLKRKVAMNRAKRRAKIIELKASEENKHQKPPEMAGSSDSNTNGNQGDNSNQPPSGGGGDAPQRIDVNGGPYGTREQSSRGRAGNDNGNRDNQRPGSSGSDNSNPNNPFGPANNMPLKHSIARLTADTDLQERAMHYHHLFLMQPEETSEPDGAQHVPSGQQRVFENEAVVTKLDKPPLHFNPRGSVDPYAYQRGKLPKPKKGLNDCIAMLKNKLVDPLPPEKMLLAEHCVEDEPPNCEKAVSNERAAVDYQMSMLSRPAEIFSHNFIPNTLVEYPTEGNLIAQNFAELPFHYVPDTRVFEMPPTESRIDTRYRKSPKKQNTKKETPRRRVTRSEKEAMKNLELMSRALSVGYPTGVSTPAKPNSNQRRRSTSQNVTVNSAAVVARRKSSALYSQSNARNHLSTYVHADAILAQRTLEYDSQCISPESQLLKISHPEAYTQVQINHHQQMLAEQMVAESYRNKKQLAICVDGNYPNKNSSSVCLESLYSNNKQTNVSPGNMYINNSKQAAISPEVMYANNQRPVLSPESIYALSKQAVMSPEGLYASNKQAAISPEIMYANSKQAISPESLYVSSMHSALSPEHAYVHGNQIMISPGAAFGVNIPIVISPESMHAQSKKVTSPRGKYANSKKQMASSHNSSNSRNNKQKSTSPGSKYASSKESATSPGSKYSSSKESGTSPSNFYLKRKQTSTSPVDLNTIQKHVSTQGSINDSIRIATSIDSVEMVKQVNISTDSEFVQHKQVSHSPDELCVNKTQFVTSPESQRNLANVGVDSLQEKDVYVHNKQRSTSTEVPENRQDLYSSESTYKNNGSAIYSENRYTNKNIAPVSPSSHYIGKKQAAVAADHSNQQHVGTTKETHFISKKQAASADKYGRKKETISNAESNYETDSNINPGSYITKKTHASAKINKAYMSTAGSNSLVRNKEEKVIHNTKKILDESKISDYYYGDSSIANKQLNIEHSEHALKEPALETNYVNKMLRVIPENEFRLQTEVPCLDDSFESKSTGERLSETESVSKYAVKYYTETEFSNIHTLPAGYGSEVTNYVSVANDVEVPLDLSKTTSKKNCQVRKDDNKMYASDTYDNYGTLDLSHKHSEEDKDVVVDLSVKITSPALDICNKVPAVRNTEKESATDLSIKSRENVVIPTDLTVKRISQNDVYEYQSTINAEYSRQDFSGKKIPTVEVTRPNLPTDLSGKHHIAPISLASINLPHRSSDSQELFENARKETSHLASGFSGNMDYSKHRLREDFMQQDSILRSESELQSSLQDRKSSFDARVLNCTQVPVESKTYRTTSPVRDYGVSGQNLQYQLETTGSSTLDVKINTSLKSGIETKTTLSLTMSEQNINVSSVTNGNSSNMSISSTDGPIPLYTTAITSATIPKHENTTPVFTLANACIPVPKIEPTNTDPLSDTFDNPNKSDKHVAPVNELTPIDSDVDYENKHTQSRDDSGINVFPEAVSDTEIVLECNENIKENKTNSASPKTITSAEDVINHTENNVKFDLETAKKIALLPKELVDILGTMPVDHRNQLLNVLPQYVSTAASPQNETTNILQNNSDGNKSGSDPNVSDLDIKPSLRHSPVSSSLIVRQSSQVQAERQANEVSRKETLVETKFLLPRKSESEKIAVETGVKKFDTPELSRVHKIVGNSVIDLTEDDVSPNDDKVKNPEEAKNANVKTCGNSSDSKLTKQKVNDKTASLRAVRIKAQSERKKSQSIDNTIVSQPADKPVEKCSVVLDQTQNNSLIMSKTLAIQQAEISSTQHSSIAGHYTYPLAISPSSTEYSGDESIKIIAQKSSTVASQHVSENTVNTKFENPLPKTGKVSSSIKTNEMSSKNVDSNLNNIVDVYQPKPIAVTNETVDKDLSSQQLAVPDENGNSSVSDNLANVNSEKVEANKEDSDDDDISLAAILKQKQRDQSVVDNIVKNKLEKINDKKKKKDRKGKKARKRDLKVLVKGLQQTQNKNTNTQNHPNQSEEVGKKDIPDAFDKKLQPTLKTPCVDENQLGGENSSECVANVEGKIETDVKTIDCGLAATCADASVDKDKGQSLETDCSKEIPEERSKLNLNCDLPCDVVVKISKCDDKLISSLEKSKENHIIKEQKNQLELSDSDNTRSRNYQTDIDTKLKDLVHKEEFDLVALCECHTDTTLKTCKNNQENETASDEVKDKRKVKRTTRLKKQDSFEKNEKLVNTEDDLNTIESGDFSATPLRRSRRGKSLFLDSNSILVEEETSSCSYVTPEHKTPLTKKQVIFSKLLLDNKNSKPSAHSTPEKDHTRASDMCDSVTIESHNSPISSIEPSKDSIGEKSKGTKRRIGSQFSKKSKKKKSVEENKLKDDILVSTDLKTHKSGTQSLALVSTKNSENLVIEKRKNINPVSFDLSESSKPKKIKLVKGDSNISTTSEIETTVNESLPGVGLETKTACYNLPLPTRRARSKSVVVKSSTYDPYEIDFDDVIEPNENKRKQDMTKYIAPKTNKRYIPCTITSEQVNKQPKKHQLVDIGEKSAVEVKKSNEKLVVSDSDDSSKSDVPLQKYVEEKEKKILEVEAMNVTETKNKTEEKVTERKNITKRYQSTKDNVQSVSAEEELRSEQFMESFGFFSERKPRKSNLLATKKISETYHITNESDDAYFGFKEKSSKKNSDSKKIPESDVPKLQPQPSTSKKAASKRGRRRKNNTKMPCYCGICKKEFRRSDNYLRHQISLLHVSNLSELELNIKFIQEPEELKQPNYLITYKQYLDRLKKLTDLLAKKKKKNARAAAKIVLPTLEEILADVYKGVRVQERSIRELSRDEALFLDCCELLREANGRKTSLDNLEKAINGISSDDDMSDDDGDVDSFAAKNILESEEVRNLENDLITGLKEAAQAKNEYKNTVKESQSLHSGRMRHSNQVQDLQEASGSNTISVIPGLHDKEHAQEANQVSKNGHVSGLSYSNTSIKEPKPVKVQKHFEFKEKMYPDIVIEDIDMFEDKFDKIKRKCRSQAAAAKQPQPIVEKTISYKGRKKTEKKKGKRSSKKTKHPSTQVPTKGALKGFDGIKVSIPTSDINISAIVSVPESIPKKKKKSSSKKKRDKKDSESSSKYDSDHRAKDASTSQNKVDVYEFLDEDIEPFDFRATTVMDRFKSMNKDVPSTSKFNPMVQDNSSQGSASDGDDFVYMSDDYVGSDDETENSLMSCEMGNGKVGSEIKKSSPQKRKDAIEKNAVMGKIFKHNAVRAEKKASTQREPEKPKANLDQLFDSLLEEEPNSSMLNSEELSPQVETSPSSKIHSESPKSNPPSPPYIVANKHRNSPSSSAKNEEGLSPSYSKHRSDSPVLDTVVASKKHEPSKKYGSPEKEYVPSSSKKYDTFDPIDYGPSTSKKHIIPMPKDCKKISPKRDSVPSKKTEEHYESKSKNRTNSVSSKCTDERFDSCDDELISCASKPDEGISTSYDYSADSYDQSTLDDDSGVARQRARRKCTVGKQNVLAETWSSESEPDGGPLRPNSAESVLCGVNRKKKSRKKDGQQAGGRRGNNRQVAFKKQDVEVRVSSSRVSSGAVSVSSGSSCSLPLDDPGEGPSGMCGMGGASRTGESASAAAAAAAMPAPSLAVAGPSGIKPRPRPAPSYWATEGDDEQEHQQQHGWIVGDSHKKLVTMLAHAKGRKRNNDDKRHLIE